MGNMSFKVERQRAAGGSTRPPAHLVWAFNNEAEAVQAAFSMRARAAEHNEVKVSVRVVRVEGARVKMWVVTERQRKGSEA